MRLPPSVLFLSIGAASVHASEIRSGLVALNASAGTLTTIALDAIDHDDRVYVGLLSVLLVIASLTNCIGRRRVR